MAKSGDWAYTQEVKLIMERFLDRFPEMFEGVNTDEIDFISTKKKKSKEPIKVYALGYPQHIFTKPFIVETFDLWWRDMDERRKNLAVWRAMCFFPIGAFDEQSKHYGKKLQPEIKMFMKEYAACGGVPNWMDNPSAVDPMGRTADEVENDAPDVEAISSKSIERTPVTREDVASVGTEDS